MTSFQSLTRGASTQHAILGDSGGSKDRAPSCDSGFASDPDRTSDVSDNKSSFLRNEILTLEKFLGQQIEINVSQQNNIDQLTQQNEQLTQQNQGLQDELRIFRSEIRSLNRKFERIESALAAKKTKKLVFPRYSQSTSFSQYILVLRNYILVMQKHWDERGYDDERTAEELFAALVHEDFFPSFLHQWDKREKTKSKICVEDVISALEQSDIRHAFSTPMERFQRLQWLEGEELHTFYQRLEIFSYDIPFHRQNKERQFLDIKTQFLKGAHIPDRFWDFLLSLSTPLEFLLACKSKLDASQSRDEQEVNGNLSHLEHSARPKESPPSPHHPPSPPRQMTAVPRCSPPPSPRRVPPTSPRHLPPASPRRSSPPTPCHLPSTSPRRLPPTSPRRSPPFSPHPSPLPHRLTHPTSSSFPLCGEPASSQRHRRRAGSLIRRRPPRKGFCPSSNQPIPLMSLKPTFVTPLMRSQWNSIPCLP